MNSGISACISYEHGTMKVLIILVDISILCVHDDIYLYCEFNMEQ